eukprot:CAMPEP_0202979874 /NCGR_PEP_ID=MMETSP1396-20130829/85911_1 /ASSEMBLY_ACC=CAM_ASM_000872 /TAXON_ID= /ORGANISM="Pseudokeronopsis sp., Strain Brazil" /LENGTH=128 /DNA_ID=CAMNT_0049719509 /DNA_START=1696 /DNA_END=2083 /DNA_ORIENTATION=-
MAEEFAKVVPQSVADACENAYVEFEGQQNIALQKEITKLLLRLRIAFSENFRIGQSYKADIRLLDSRTNILLTGPHHLNQETGLPKGFFALKKKHLEDNAKERIVLIDAKDFAKMKEAEKMQFLCDFN